MAIELDKMKLPVDYSEVEQAAKAVDTLANKIKKAESSTKFKDVLSGIDDAVGSLDKANKFLEKGLPLTKKQAVNLAELLDLMKKEGQEAGKTAEAIRSQQRRFTAAFTERIKQYNDLQAQAKATEKANREESERTAKEAVEQAKRARAAMLREDKAYADASKQIWKEWASSVGKQTPEQKSLSDYYKGLEQQQLKVVQAGNKMNDSLTQTRNLMAEGFTKGEANILKAAKAAGIAGKEYTSIVETLKDIRRLSADPFDSAIGSVRSITREFDALKVRADLVTQGIELSSRQMREYSRLADEAFVKTKAAGFTPDAGGQFSGEGLRMYNTLLKDSQTAYLNAAKAVNSLKTAEKDLAVQHRESANAKKFLISEDERMLYVVNQVTASEGISISVSERVATATSRYAAALRKAGIDGVEAANKLKVYEAQLRKVEEVEEKRRVDRLSRALAPQISDITVGLASGQSLMTVLLQQGLQVRDLIGQSGVAVEDLQVAFRRSAADMVSSIAGTAKAVGVLLVGALESAGKAVFNLVPGFKSLNEVAAASALPANALRVAFITLGSTAGLLLSVITAFAVANIAASKSQDDLSKALITTGAQLGMTSRQAMEYSRVISETYGVSVRSAQSSILEFAKAGISANDQMIVSAIELSKVTGESLDKIIARYKDLESDPAKSLAKIAAGNGLISVETLKQIKLLEDQGNKIEAVRVAREALAAADKAAAAIALSQLSGIGRLWFDVKRGIDGAIDSVYAFFTQTEALKYVKGFIGGILAIFEGIKFVVFEAVAGLRTLGGALGALLQGDVMGAKKILEANTGNFLKNAETTGQRIKNIYKEVFEVTSQDEVAARAAAEARKKQADEAKRLLDSWNKTKEKEKAVKEDNTAENAAARVLRVLQKMGDESEKEIKQAQDAAARVLNVMQDITKEAEKANAAYAKFAETVGAIAAENRKNIQDSEADINLRLQLMTATESEAKAIRIEYEKQNKLSQIELDYQKQILKIQEAKAKAIAAQNDPNEQARILKEAQDALDQADADRNRKRELADKDAAVKAAEYQYQEFKKIVDDVAGAIETALFEGGKAGRKKLRDIIVAELRKPIKMVINAVVNTLLGSVANSVFGSGVGGAVGSAGSSILGSVGGSALTNSLGLSGTFSSMGQYFATGFMNTIAGTGAAAGATAGSAVGGASGAAMQIGAYAPYAAAAVAVLNVLGAFRKTKTVGGGLTGTLGTGDISAYDLRRKSGSLLSGPDYSIGNVRVTPESRALQNAFGIMRETTAGMAEQLGIANDAILSFTTRLGNDLIHPDTGGYGIRFDGLNEEQRQAAIEKAMTQANEDLAKFALDLTRTIIRPMTDAEVERALAEGRGVVFGMLLSKTIEETVGGSGDIFVREGETAVQALTRLSTNISIVNSAIDTLNLSLLETSLVGADTASKLIDLFGSADAFVTTTSSYFQNFYDEEERLQIKTRQLTTALSELGVALPESRNEFRKLIEAQDLGTEEGRKMFASLMNLSSAYAEITQQAEGTAGSVSDLVSAIDDAINDLLGKVSTPTGSMRQVTARSLLESTIASGTISDRGMLEEAVGVLVSGFEGSSFVSKTEKDLAALNLARMLQSVKAIPGYADGGYYSGGLALVGEKGPELINFSNPGQVYTAGQTSSIISDTDSRLNSIERQLELLRAETRANVENTAKTSKILNRVLDSDNLKVQVVGTVTTTPA